ncbi:hypothetical protein AX16_000936, partial [Volvariella volvacea WC 439]
MPPWPVILLPKGERPVIWCLVRLPDGNYHIKSSDGELGAVDKKLENWKKIFTNLESGEEWRLEHVPEQGPHAYRILKHNTPDRWVSLKPDEQIVLDQPNGVNANDVFEIHPVFL